MPLVHTAHTLAKVKNPLLADGDRPEPRPGHRRGAGRRQADRLVANTPTEAHELMDLYDANPEQVAVVEPGVDLDRFRPRASRGPPPRRLGLPRDAHIIAFVGRIQPLKAPDVLLQALADLRERDPDAGHLTRSSPAGRAGRVSTGRPR